MKSIRKLNSGPLSLLIENTPNQAIVVVSGYHLPPAAAMFYRNSMGMEIKKAPTE